jgi:murein tripeptide amidase MpaA
MKICSNFDAGSILVNSIDAHTATLSLKKDSSAGFMQWFYFKVQVDKLTHCTFSIINAGESSYPDGWVDYNVCYSYDRQSWSRIKSYYNEKILSFDLLPEQQSFYIAYFAPYSFERHLDFLSYAQISPLCELVPVCNTVDGRELTMLKIGQGDKCYWITARQHPGESMAEWFIEGFVEKLLDEDDTVSQKLLSEATFYVIPNMNPDGSVRGNLRTNASGANLNREWLSPTIDKSPEVFYVRKLMHEIGVDLFLDIHGDEAIPYNFVAGNEGNPSYGIKIQQLEDKFKSILLEVSSEFQTKFWYDLDKPGEADLSKATNYVGEYFDCLAYTIEMPFKDNMNCPDTSQGWSIKRSKKFSEDIILTLFKML